MEISMTIYLVVVRKFETDTNQVDKSMTKYTKDTSQFDQSSQYTRQCPTKYRKDLSRRRTRHRPEHQMFFLMVFLQDKMFVNKLSSL